MAATIYITLTTFVGLDIREAKLHVNPHLPKKWSRIKFNTDFNGVNYSFDMTKESCFVTSDKDTEIIYKDKVATLKANEKQELK